MPPIAQTGEHRASSITARGSESYPGAKGGAGVWQAIISQFPPHSTYIEPFLGSGVVLRMKRPARSTIGIDCDAAVVETWRSYSKPGFRAILGDAISHLRVLPVEPDTVIYCDPPYLRSVRSCQRDYYRHEFDTSEQHGELLSLLRTMAAAIVISGYRAPLYDEMLADWRTVQIPTVNRAGQKVTEWLWCNFAEPFALHDYRFLGRNFRERERIKRKKARWKARLLAMPRLERAAVLAAIDDAVLNARNGEDAGAELQK